MANSMHIYQSKGVKVHHQRAGRTPLKDLQWLEGGHNNVHRIKCAMPIPGAPAYPVFGPGVPALSGQERGLLS